MLSAVGAAILTRRMPADEVFGPTDAHQFGDHPPQPHPGARIHCCGCSLPGLTGFTVYRREGTRTGDPTNRSDQCADGSGSLHEGNKGSQVAWRPMPVFLPDSPRRPRESAELSPSQRSRSLLFRMHFPTKGIVDNEFEEGRLGERIFRASARTVHGCMEPLIKPSRAALAAVFSAGKARRARCGHST